MKDRTSRVAQWHAGQPALQCYANERHVKVAKTQENRARSN